MRDPLAVRRHPRILFVLLLVALPIGFIPNPAGAATSGTTASTVPATSTAPTADDPSHDLSVAEAVALGLVEGITEFLPISSTGHLTVTADLLGLTDTQSEEEAIDSYTIAIQLGAILAVIVLYWRRISDMGFGLFGRNADGRRVLVAVAVAFAPAALIGLAFDDTIKDELLGPIPVAIAWAVGGVLILVASKIWERRVDGRPLESITSRDALIIGFCQAAALWPGVSRSLVTILAGLAIGLRVSAAVEFSFLLGLATLGAATVYEGASNGSEMVDAFGLATPLLGLVIAFISAVAAVRWMVAYLERRGLGVFGWYRLAAAATTVVLLATGVL